MIQELSTDEQRRVDAFIALTRLERGLRTYLSSELNRIKGPAWMNSLPQDVKKKIGDGGLEVSDFPDLKKILASNWRHLEIPSDQRKAVALAHLEGLESIRNAIAHSRDISDGELRVAQAALHVLSPVLGKDAPALSMPPTSHPDIALDRIRTAIEFGNAVPETDFAAIQSESVQHDLKDAIERYSRIRVRPGRKTSLLSETQRAALQLLARCSTNEADATKSL